MSSTPEPVRLPAVLAGYGCGRTLMCCHEPWRPHLRDADVDHIRSELSPEATRRLRGALLPDGPGRFRLAKRDGRCRLLDRADCALQVAGGLSAMPPGCRSFPRVVTETPLGLEVGFVLACPTAAGMVAEAPAPFGWARVARAGWAYPPTRWQPSPIRADGAGRTMSFEALQALRDAWWAGLAGATGEALVQQLAGLAVAPLRPEDAGGAEPSAIEHGFAAKGASEVAGLIGRLPGWASRSAGLGAALSGPRRVVELAGAARDPAFSCAAALAVQLAGVHDGAPVADGLRRAARQTALALGLWLALDDVAAALACAAQIVRFLG